MVKSKQTDMITVSELARRAGVGRSAASLWVSSQEKAGTIITRRNGRRGKLVDVNDVAVRQYIQNTYGRSRRADNGSAKSGNTLQKMRYQAKKMSYQNLVLRQKYIDGPEVLALVNELLRVEKEVFAEFSNKALKQIQKELSIKIASSKRKQAKELIDQVLKSAHEMNSRTVHDLKIAYPGQIL